jgi:superfamily II RNA helicase
LNHRTYQGLSLDPFQQQAFAAIDSGCSLIVTAPTGTGKTLVADYLIEKTRERQGQIIYTAPIKALSNQKYKDFCRQYGPESVGLITGDVVIHQTAPLLIMTTEIFRNQVITEDPCLQFVSYIIFDEIHWLNDEERGTVWEESIILAPPHIKLLGLSATIANAPALVRWIESIRQEKIVLVEEYQRIVPLEYFYFTKETGPVSYEKFQNYLHTLPKVSAKDAAKEAPKYPLSSHLDLIKRISPDYLPILYFVFSRKQCTEKAHELSLSANYLSPEEKSAVEQRFQEKFGPEEEWSASTQMLKRTTVKGISYHHAGLLPSQKAIVEELFQTRLIRVLYCTETFSVGINYPVKSVCFDSLRKFDGRSFRTLANHEFFQISGRAGRRGLDAKGYSFILVDLKNIVREPLPRFNLNQLEPLASQLKLSYNTVLNLTANLTQEQIAVYFQKSFAAYNYQQDSASLQATLAQTEQRLAAIKDQHCQHFDTHACPLKYQPKQKALERLRKSYGSLGSQRKNRVYAKDMARRIKRLEKLLQQPPQECPTAQRTICRASHKSYHKLAQTQRELVAELSRLPAPRAFLDEYAGKLNHLRHMGYLRDNELLPRGECAAKIYVQELFVTELIFSDIFSRLNDDQLNALISAIDYEARKNDYFQKNHIMDWEPVNNIAVYIQEICGPHTVRYDHRAAVIAYAWSQGESLPQIQQLCNLDEGDIISVFRRTIDLLRQIRDAVSEPALKGRLKDCMNKLDRDEASILNF